MYDARAQKSVPQYCHYTCGENSQCLGDVAENESVGQGPNQIVGFQNDGKLGGQSSPGKEYSRDCRKQGRRSRMVRKWLSADLFVMH